MAGSWQDALMRLHVSGWDTDEIDAACDALAEACDEGALEGTPIAELTAEQIGTVLENPLSPGDAAALRVVADLRHQVGSEAEALRAALYDLDAFAYAFSGDD